jgi:hypothetical protein
VLTVESSEFAKAGADPDHGLAIVLKGHFCGWRIDGDDAAESVSFHFAYLISEHSFSFTFTRFKLRSPWVRRCMPVPGYPMTLSARGDGEGTLRSDSGGRMT